jgi:lipoprotein NlpI
MNKSRLDHLLQFYKEDPGDPFNLYAIAMEYQGQDDPEAKVYFDLLLEYHSHYLPTYYHAASFYASKGDKEKAEEIYKLGITLAREVNNQHALRELRSAYNNFLYEDEN